MQINTDARLRALRATFLILAAIALLAIVPARGLPGYVPGEVSPGPPRDVSEQPEQVAPTAA